MPTTMGLAHVQINSANSRKGSISIPRNTLEININLGLFFLIFPPRFSFEAHVCERILEFRHRKHILLAQLDSVRTNSGIQIQLELTKLNVRLNLIGLTRIDGRIELG